MKNKYGYHAKVLITGASGYIGSNLTRRLMREGVEVRAVDRWRDVDGFVVHQADVTDRDAMAGACEGIETIIHCAGYAHAKKQAAEKEVEVNRKINVLGTENTIECAARSQVKRFVYLSSVKSISEDTRRIRYDEEARGPVKSPYGISKRLADEVVRRVGKNAGMETVIIHPAMVYGKGDRANMRRMVDGIRSGWFPPIPETGNKRSMVHLEDMIEAIVLCSSHPRAANESFIVASSEAFSGAEIYDTIRRMLSRVKVRWRIPSRALRLLGKMGDMMAAVGARSPVTSDAISSLLDSAWYSPEKIGKYLGWRSSIGLEEGLRGYL